MSDMEMSEVSAAKNLVLAVLGDFDLPEDFDGIQAADRIITNLLAGGVLIPEWMPDPVGGGRPAQGYHPTASQMEAWQGRAVTPRRVTGR